MAVGAHAEQHEVKARRAAAPGARHAERRRGRLEARRVVLGGRGRRRRERLARRRLARRRDVGRGQPDGGGKAVERLFVRRRRVGVRQHLVVDIKEVHLGPVDALRGLEAGQHLEHGAAGHGGDERALFGDRGARRLGKELAEARADGRLGVAHVDGHARLGRWQWCVHAWFVVARMV